MPPYPYRLVRLASDFAHIAFLEREKPNRQLRVHDDCNVRRFSLHLLENTRAYAKGNKRAVRIHVGYDIIKLAALVATALFISDDIRVGLVMKRTVKFFAHGTFVFHPVRVIESTGPTV